MVGSWRLCEFSVLGPRWSGALRVHAAGIAMVMSGPAALGQTGACCTPSGACTLGPRAQCISGGMYQGDGSSCAGVSCPQPTGACCNGSWNCTLQLREVCQGAGSTYFGDRVACGTGSSGSLICPIGACCLSDGVCTAGVAQMDCLALGGAFQGTGTTCVAVTCPLPSGACCSGAGCAAVTLPLCTLFQGTWRGPSTACAPGNTCPPVGVCCRGTTCSAAIGLAECVPPAPGVGARFAAGAPQCNAAGESKFPCCHADFDGSGGLSAQDIFDFLNAWFAQSPFCHVGGNGVEPPTVQDIFDYLADWFAGC